MKENHTVGYVLFAVLFGFGLSIGVSTARQAGTISMPHFAGCFEYGLPAYLQGEEFWKILLYAMGDVLLLAGISMLCTLGKLSFCAFPVFALGKGFKSGCAVAFLVLAHANWLTVALTILLLLFFAFLMAGAFAGCMETVFLQFKRKLYFSWVMKAVGLAAVCCAFYVLLLIRFGQDSGFFYTFLL